MNLDGFAPTPIVGNQYKKTDGTKITVIAIDYVDGQLYVLYEENGVKSSVYQAGWNDMHLTEVRKKVGSGGGSVPPPPENPNSGATVTPEEPASVSDTDKVRKLQELLDNGPTADLNPNFYPTDFAANVSSNELVDDELVGRLQKQLDDIQELRDKGDKNKAGFINEFLWNCAGVDKRLLRMCQSDWSKKAGIGGTILGTAILALLSGTYAAYTVSGNFFGAIFIGLVWGLFIFNLDRYLVNSMYSDGTSKITLQEWKSASPRLIIALFIGIVISTPVEMLMFDGAIKEYNQEQLKLKITDGNADDILIAGLDKRIESVKEQITSAEKDYNHKKTVTENERSGKYGTAGSGPKTADYKKAEEKAEKRLDSLRIVLSNLEQEKITATNTYKDNTIALDSTQFDFSRRLEAMLKITSFYKPIIGSQVKDQISTTDDVYTNKSTISEEEKEMNPLFWVRLLIMCFFMIIEITPVLAKMMADDGKYEEYIILESKTMDKLRRVRECNDINVMRGGFLSMYSGWILGLGKKESVLDMEDPKSVQEGNASLLVKEDGTKKKKLLTDADNLKIYEHALKRCTEYIMSQIDAIFDVPTSAVPGSTAESEPVTEQANEGAGEQNSTDPSDEAISIG